MTHLTRLTLAEVDGWAAARPYVQRLLDAGAEVEALYRPTSAEELRAVFADANASGLTCLPVGSGHGGSRYPKGPLAFVDTTDIAGEIRIDRRSCVAHVPAGTTWWKLGEQISDAGLMLGPVVDGRPGRTVGGTLCGRQLLPTVWLARTARSLCLGLRATDLHGGEYGYREAPRTSSGPDLRALFCDSEGRAGVVTEVALQLTPAASVEWYGADLPWGAWARIRRVLDLHPGVITLLRGTATRRFRVAVVRGSHVADRAVDQLVALGFSPSDDDGDDDAPSVVLSMPWQLLPGAARAQRSKRLDLRVIGGGATHVAVAARLAEAEAERQARAWAGRIAAKAPGLTRIGVVSLLESPAAAWALDAIAGGTQ